MGKCCSSGGGISREQVADDGMTGKSGSILDTIRVISFLSYMSMPRARDNEQYSYLKIVDATAQNGASREEYMKELSRGIVFMIMVSNTDDHLRNHGFIYERYKGWSLSKLNVSIKSLFS